jgi:ribosomal protein S18 acetylase RimI-like enzyme
MMNLGEYMDLARAIEVYSDIELDILEEALRDCAETADMHRSLIEIRDGRILAGFAVLKRAVDTDFTFEIRAFCIDRGYRGKKVAEQLVAIIEEKARELEPACIVRIETSSRREASYGAGLFDAAGFSMIGHIADFYGAGDDFFIYAKHLQRKSNEHKDDRSSDRPAIEKDLEVHL